MFSHEYPIWGCRCCSVAEGGRPHKLWSVYTVDAEYSKAKQDYYQLKAKYDAVQEICDRGRDQILAEELEMNAVNLEQADSDRIAEAIKKYRYYKPTKSSTPFSFASFSFSEPAATEGSETSSTTEAEGAAAYTGAWGTNTSPVGAQGLQDVANTQDGTNASTTEEEVVYEPVLIRPVVAKHEVDGQLVNAPSLGGWSPDMKKIAEATEAEQQFISG
jgi:hypothetical protein